MKKRIFLSLVLFLFLALGLSGCGKAPKVVGLVVSAPNEIVVDSTLNEKGLEVYRIYDTGNVEKLTSDQFHISAKLESGASKIRAGIFEVTVTDLEKTDPKDKKKQLTTTYHMVNKKDATSVIEEEDNFYVFQFKAKKNEEGKLLSVPFQHHIGYSFDYENMADHVTVFKVTASEDGNNTVQVDVTSEIAASLANREEDIKYKQEDYQVTFTYDGIEGSFDVFAIGGSKPIHAKSANWFDYILIIPVGWILQLFAFGGNFGVGILFTTIIIRTLAWPVYAKTNAMSANMNEAQPELQRIQAKYRGRTDKESQRLMQMETMQVYKKYKIGMGSMVLPFVQMPIFIAMYQTVSRILVPGGYWAAKITRRTFLGIDLTIGHHWTSYILAALVGGTMILLQWLSTRKPKGEKKTLEHKKDDKANQQAKTMKIVSYVMVAMMVIFSLQNNALALYWVFGNIYSIGQNMLGKELTRRKKAKREKETFGGILWKE